MKMIKTCNVSRKYDFFSMYRAFCLRDFVHEIHAMSVLNLIVYYKEVH